jgi:hypothetical protein
MWLVVFRIVKPRGEHAKWPPITVEEAILSGDSDSYGRAERWKGDEEARKKVETVVGVQEVTVA